MRLLQELSQASALAARRSTEGDASLIAVQCEAETVKLRPPRAKDLGRRLRAAVTEVQRHRHLQGLPTDKGIGLFGGVPAAKLIEIWQDTLQETMAADPSKDVVVGADGVRAPFA